MAHSGKAYFFFFLLFFCAGCGETSLFEGLGDDKSSKAKEEQAREALDKGDCATAVNLFTELQASDPDNVDRRLDLSAAYLCQAGFSVQELFKVVADFGSEDEAGQAAEKGSLFVKITEQVSEFVPDTALWQANVCKSKALLGTVTDDGNANWPCLSATETQNGVTTPIFFNDDKDAGYILSIVNLADATLSVADALNTANGVTQCAQQTAQASQTGTSAGCEITLDDLTSIVGSLSAAVATGTQGQLSTTVEAIFDASDDDNDGTISSGEMLTYLAEQNLVTQTVLVPGNCTYTGNPPKYDCGDD